MTDRIQALEAVSRRLEPGSAERRELRERIVEYCEDYYRRLPDAPAYRADHTGAADQLRSVPIGERGVPLDDVLAVVRDAVDVPGLSPPSAGHLGYIPGGGVYAAALGDYMAAVTNRYAGVRFACPGAVEMEEVVLGWMAGLIGYGDGWGGNLTSGGSVANLIGIVTARESRALKARDFHRAVVYTTSQVHHCVDRALRTAGMAECVRREVPMDRGFRMRPDGLEAAIHADRQAGLLPWLVVASAGTTDVGAIDPLEEVGRVSRAEGLWYHVDAAYGGFFALCEDVAPRLAGLAMADTVVLDPHKGLFLPFGTGAILARDKAALYHAHTYHAHYMQDTVSERTIELASPGDLSHEFTKHFRGPRVWLPLMVHGVEPFRACLEEKLLLTRYFHDRVAALGFEVGPEPDLSVATYRWIPDEGDPDAFNQRLIARIHEDGRIFVTSTRIDGKFVLRAAVLTFRTHREHVDLLLEILETAVRDLERGGRGSAPLGDAS